MREINFIVDDDAATWTLVTVTYDELSKNNSWDKIGLLVDQKMRHAKMTMMNVIKEYWGELEE